MIVEYLMLFANRCLLRSEEWYVNGSTKLESSARAVVMVMLVIDVLCQDFVYICFVALFEMLGNVVGMY